MDRLIVGDHYGDAYRAAIELSTSYEQLQAAVTQVYRHASPSILAQRCAEALVLAELAGMYSVAIDNPLSETLLHMQTTGSRWRVPGFFRDAVRWISDRIERATTVPVVYEFGEKPRQRAPMVAAATQLDTAAKLRAKAESGAQLELPLGETKREMYALLKELGCDPEPKVSHPIIQEETQTRFARTRESILSLDFYRAAYPFWRFDATLDDRTTAGCRALNGLTMPASDPKWVGFVPPRHWNCRSHVRGVVHSEGVNAKLTQPIGEYAGDGSFGTLREEWEPKPGSYPEDLWDIYASAKGIASPHIEIPGAWWRKKRSDG